MAAFSLPLQGSPDFLDCTEYFFLSTKRPQAVHGLLIFEVSRSQTTTHYNR